METTFPKTGTPGIATATKTRNSIASSDTAETAGRAHTLVDRATDGAHGTVDRLADKAADLQTVAYTKFDDFMNSEDKAEAARGEIRAHPLTLVGIALLVGVVLGRL